MKNKDQQRNAVEDALRGFRITGKIECSSIKVKEENGLWWVEVSVPMDENGYPKDEISNIKQHLVNCFDYDESNLEIGNKESESDMTFDTKNPATNHVVLQVVDRR